MPRMKRSPHPSPRRLTKLLWAVVPVILLSSAWAAPSRPLELFLPNAPPLSMPGQPEQRGIVGDATVKAAAVAGFDLHFITLPWSRAQQTVEHGRDQLIIPLSRTLDREAKYTWIAPIMSMDRAFFSLDNRVENFAQARKTYHRIAVGMGSAQERKLRDEGFSDEQIYPLKIGENPAQMLLLGRVDAWFNGVPESRYIWREVSDRPLLMSPVLMTADLYLACSRDCAEPIVKGLREAVATLRKDGTLERLMEVYAQDAAH